MELALPENAFIIQKIENTRFYLPFPRKNTLLFCGESSRLSLIERGIFQTSPCDQPGLGT